MLVVYQPGVDLSKVPDGSALRVTAVVEIDVYSCGATGICGYGPRAPTGGGGWLDWTLRLDTGGGTGRTAEPAPQTTRPRRTQPGPTYPPGTIGVITKIVGKGASVLHKGGTTLVPIYPNFYLKAGDVIVTTPGTAVRVEFTVGGAAVVGKGGVIEVGETGVTGGTKVTPAYLVYPPSNGRTVEIQDNGGAGIKG